VITRRIATVRAQFADIPRVTVLPPDEVVPGPLVIECTGQWGRLAPWLARLHEGTVLGLLGSPRKPAWVDLYALHRAGLCVVGLHELFDYRADVRQSLFSAILAWLDQHLAAHDPRWFRYWPAAEYWELYKDLQQNRHPEPFQILEWATRPLSPRGAIGETGCDRLHTSR
jgi:hypothetical protein